MNEDDVVDIVDPSTDEVVSHCYGPSSDGACPLAGSDRVVGCHGNRIAGRSVGPELWNLYVPPGSQHCPRAWNLESLGY
jgi:hypothetical protein